MKDLQQAINQTKAKIEFLEENYNGPLKEERIKELTKTVDLFELALIEEEFDEEYHKIHKEKL